MTASDEIRNDQAERDGLEKVISDVETQLSVSTPGTRAVFEQFLQNAKGRVATLETKIHKAEAEEERHAESEAALVGMAEKETALNEKEKEQYSGFLKEDFFTKNDFGTLEKFYAHTWDRLSEHGKDEMSHRVWEGVRRNEYKFTDLPKDVQEKEEKQAYRMLNQQVAQRNAPVVPEQDRQDFIQAYQNGNHAEAANVLNRESFKQGLFRADLQPPILHSAVVGASTSAVLLSAKVDSEPPQKTASPPSDLSKGLDVSGVDLGSLKLADGDIQTPSARTVDSGSTRSV